MLPFASLPLWPPLYAAFTAFVQDVINEYMFGKHYNDLGKEDFDAGMVVAAQADGLMWRTTKFIRFSGPLMRSIPPKWIMSLRFYHEGFLPLHDGKPPLAAYMTSLTANTYFARVCVNFHE